MKLAQHGTVEDQLHALHLPWKLQHASATKKGCAWSGKDDWVLYYYRHL